LESTLVDRRLPSKDEIAGYLKDRSNWGRWPDNPSAGTTNLITPAKRREAAGLVRTGQTVSLSRALPTEPAPDNPQPVQQFVKTIEVSDDVGAAMDYLGVFQHGFSVTHIDALSHFWDADGMFEGHDPNTALTFDGAKFGGVEAWRDGIVTRGVLLDVPKQRGGDFVRMDTPVHGWELEEIVAAEGITLEPGDAVIIHCGREQYAEANGGYYAPIGEPYPGLDGSTLPFFKDNDVGLLVWDMEDAAPNQYDLPVTVHGAINAYGLAMVDNALLEPLANACEATGRYEFMLVCAPLVFEGGTGSPVNPLAIF
jgi:kynurenine formamidase